MKKKYFDPEITIIYFKNECLFNSAENNDNLGNWDSDNWE